MGYLLDGETRSALFWDTSQRVLVIYCRRCGKTYRAHLQGSRIQISTRNIPAERICHILHGRSLNSHMEVRCLNPGRGRELILLRNVPTNTGVHPASFTLLLLLNALMTWTGAAWLFFPSHLGSRTRGHASKLRLCLKNCTSIYAVQYTAYYFFFGTCGPRTVTGVPWTLRTRLLHSRHYWGCQMEGL